MLTIFRSGRQEDCDGISRRDFLKIGSLGIAGFTLADLLRAEAHAAARATGKSLINIFLRGGPSHIDMFDMKPHAPREIRGEFQQTSTSVPGFEICELMPRLAGMADKFAVIRSITGLNDEHSNSQSDSGWPERGLSTIGGHPSIGSVMSKLFGANTGAAPTFLDLTDDGVTRPGFLGPVYRAYCPDDVGRANLKLNGGLDTDRLGERKSLRQHLDRLRREIDSSGMMEAVDSFSQRAVEIVASGRLADALDLSTEDPQHTAEYGIDQEPKNGWLVMARRLIEAGSRCVAIGFRGWDTHDTNFPRLRKLMPAIDAGLSALIADLDRRGRLDDTLVLVSGEFGRTPRVNKNGGRDHWPRVGFYFLAGGGLRTGQVIGSTNRLGESALDRPIHYQQVFALLYRQLGIDPDTVTLTDPNGRPQYLVDHREPLSELI